MVRQHGGGQEGKLTGAVDHWLGPDDGDDSAFLEDAEFYNITIEEAPQGRPDYEVWEEHWDALLLFIRAQTQWRLNGNGGVTGLDYAGVLALLPLYPVDDPARVFDDLRVMEARAVELLNERAAKAAKKAERARHAGRARRG